MSSINVKNISNLSNLNMDVNFVRDVYFVLLNENNKSKLLSFGRCFFFPLGAHQHNVTFTHEKLQPPKEGISLVISLYSAIFLLQHLIKFLIQHT